MKQETFLRSVELPVAAAAAFAWHARPGALERLLPPWDDVRVLSRSGGLEDGAQVELSVPAGPIRLKWVAEHRDVQPPYQFRDVAIRGPLPLWDHCHRFEPLGPDACTLTDRIDYACPGGPVGRLLKGRSLRRELERMFRYRHDTTAADLAMHAQYADRPRMKVAVSGASGMVGTALRHLLTTGGHEVVPLRRDAANRIDAGPADGADAVVHLAGESIAALRWSEQKKRKIRDSRVDVTQWLADDLLKLPNPPKALLAASAVGFYGSRGDETLRETSARGDGFLAEVCVGWEDAARKARDGGIRVATLRFGAILSPQGGALRLMLPAFRMGAGGRIGSGTQYMSWVGLDDAVAAIHHVLMAEGLAGPINVTAPEPVTNAQFAQTLARVLHRPALVPVPAMAARATLGEMADSLLLASQRVVPATLEETGFTFRNAHLQAALHHLLGRAPH